MTEMILSLLNPNTLLPHRAGTAGLALALSAISKQDNLVKWEISEEEVKLDWNCTDQEAISWLLSQVYQIKEGYLYVPALKLDSQTRYVFSEGVVTTFLQHSKQRSLDKQATTLSFTIDESQPEIQVSYRPILSCYYTGDFKEAFNNKGQFKKSIPLKGHHLPGLVECFVHGAYQESPENYLSLLFLPIACHYYRLPGYLSGLVIPEIKNLKIWVKRRQAYTGKTAVRLKSPYGEFQANGAAESGLRFLLQEKLIDDEKTFKVDYCEVYRLGKQPWDGNQSYLKQEVYRVEVTDAVLELYQQAWSLFPPVVRTSDKGENWLATSHVLPWIADNLVLGKRWYQGFFEFRKAQDIYEHQGLIKMTQINNALTDQERIFFEAIQGSFRKALSEEKKLSDSQHRKFDYDSVYKKALYRLQTPSTQFDFAKAVVDFISRYPNPAARGFGPEIYHWLHHDNNWRKARDLALLAIATYTGKNKKGETEVSETVLDQNSDAEESDSGLELSII